VKRKYADGGLVVSRGYDAGLGNIRLMDMPDVSLAPSAAMAADRMASDDTVSARPSMKELQDANLKAVREREARETARPVRRVKKAAAKTKGASAAPAAKTTGESEAFIRAFIRENDKAADASLRAAAVDAARRRRTGSNAAAVDAALLRQMQGRGPTAGRLRAPMAMKNGGSVKKADAMKKMPAKAMPVKAMPKKAMPMAMKKAMPMAAMMAKKPAKKSK
jgi:hypothetical protein